MCGCAPGALRVASHRSHSNGSSMSRSRSWMLADSKTLTMRRVAEQLGVVAPSLYWHVKTKDDIIDLAVDHVFADAKTPTGQEQGGWRECIENIALAWRATLVAHPWVAPVAASRPSFGPSYLDQLELVMSTLNGAGLDGPALSSAMWTLHNLIFGSASTEATLSISDHDREAGQLFLQQHSDRRLHQTRWACRRRPRAARQRRRTWSPQSSTENRNAVAKHHAHYGPQISVNGSTLLSLFFRPHSVSDDNSHENNNTTMMMATMPHQPCAVKYCKLSCPVAMPHADEK